MAHAPVFPSRGGAADRWRIRLFVLRGGGTREKEPREASGKEAYGGRSTYCPEDTGEFWEKYRGVAEIVQHQLQPH